MSRLLQPFSESALFSPAGLSGADLPAPTATAAPAATPAPPQTATPAPALPEQSSVGRTSLRIAVVTETWPPEVNGVATTIARFVDGLSRRGHAIQLIRPRQPLLDDLPPGSTDQQASARSDSQLAHLPMRGMSIPGYPNLKLGLPASGQLTRTWSDQRPDLVHLVTEGPLGWSALRAARALGIPVSSDFRTNFHAYSQHYRIGWLRKPIEAYLRNFHNHTQLTMVPTGAIRQQLRSSGFRNLHVIGRGVDTRLFHPDRRSAELRHSWGVGPHTPVVLHVGRLAAEKNLSALVTAFEQIRRREPRARLVLVGEGPAMASLRHQCPQAIFAGLRQHEDLATHYASGDLFLFPSLTETYGNVTLEAMASGLAVVAYRYAAAAELIDHGRNGMLADFDDTSQLARLSSELIGDPLRLRTVGQRARSQAMNLGWDQVVSDFETALMGVVLSA